MALKFSMKTFLPPLDLGWNRVRYHCGQPECHNKQLMRYVPGSRAGIHVGDRWYCSPDCFASGSRHALSALASGCVVEMPRNPRLSLGLALLSRKLLSEDQLRFATIRSQCQGETLESTLLNLGMVDEKQLAAGRSAQWGYPVLGHEPSGHVAEAHLPPSLLKICSAVPIHFSPKVGRLVLGFVHRVEHSLLQPIEQITGFRPEPCFITPTEFAEQMQRISPAPGYEEIVVDSPAPIAQMARTLGGYAVEFAVAEVAFARCKSWLWSRLIGKRGTVDVIFSMKESAPVRKHSFSSHMPEVTPALG